MRRKCRFRMRSTGVVRFGSSVLALAAVCLVTGSASARPAVGDPAPDFVLSGSDGKQYALAEFVGKRGVVLAWFPKAFTPG